MSRPHAGLLRLGADTPPPPRHGLLARLDPRAKLLLSFGAAVLVLSEPPGSVRPFASYGAMVLVLVMGARLSPRFMATRLAAVLPFVLLTAALVLLTGAGSADVALSLVLRAAAAVLLLGLLIGTEPVDRILWAMGTVGLPRFLVTQAAFTLRFAAVLSDEAGRTELARRARTPGPLRVGRLRTLGQQAALIFLRGWQRAGRVHQAMLARGFQGQFPDPATGAMPVRDLLLALAAVLAFAAVRMGSVG